VAVGTVVLPARPSAASIAAVRAHMSTPSGSMVRPTIASGSQLARVGHHIGDVLLVRRGPRPGSVSRRHLVPDRSRCTADGSAPPQHGRRPAQPLRSSVRTVAYF
jgi:hypothetical protein